MQFFRKIWAIYGFLVFFFLWVLFFPFYLLAFLLFPKGWHKYIIWFSHHVYTRLYFALILVRIKVKGKEKLNPQKTYIIVSNHCTFLYFMMNAYAYSGVYKYLAKKELSRIPFFGYIVKRLCVLVDRSSRASRASSIRYLKRTLDEGYSVFLYPEGTRNHSGQLLGTFQKGAFKIAIETGTPIAVQTITKVRSISHTKKTVDLRPGSVTVVWESPIDVSKMSLKDMPELIDKVRKIMEKNLQNSLPKD